MAFLPGLTTTRSSQNVKRRSKRRETVKKSGYRISFTDINKTTEQSDSNVVARCPDRTNDTGRREILPPLEESKINVVADFNEEVKAKPLKLPKCPSSVINNNSMFWIEPLGLWVPLQQRRKLYEKFSRRINLLCKDPDYSMDPCPHIPRCDHSRSWSAVKLERQKFRELRELRNKQSLEKTLERYRNMQEFWLEQMNNRNDMLHATPSHLRLQNFRKTTGFLAPLNEAQRFERLQERHEKQREWEEAWKLACEKRRKADRKKNPRNILPQIIVTDYEFVFTCDEHVTASNQSHDLYFEESYHVICRPVQYISEENLRTQFLSKRLQGFQHKEPARCDSYAGFDSTENVTASFDPSEKEPGSFEPPEKSRSFASYGNFATTKTWEFEPHTILDHTNKIPGEPPPGNRLDSPRNKNADIKECDESTSESSITQDPILVTPHTCSGSSLDTDIAEVCMTGQIKHADNTADLMRRLVPVPLGVSSGRILDPQLTASSGLDVYHTADQARLHNEKHDKKGGAWLPRKHDVSPYLQVDLGHVTTIHQVATQGNPASAVKNERHKRWVTKYSLEFSQDGNEWTDYLESGELKIFTGNSDLETVVLNSLENAVETRYVRFRPKEWHNGIAMRVEVFGSNSFPDEQREEIQTLITETDIAEESGNETTEEKPNDSLVEKNQESQMFFREVDMNLKNMEFGLLVEERVVTPPVVHSPVPSLLSPREQKVEIEHIMESQICSQNLRLREFSDLSEVESTTTQELRDDTQDSSSADTDTLLENAEVLTSDETQELQSQLSEQDIGDTNDIGDINNTDEASDTANTNESTPLPSPSEKDLTPHATPPPVVPSPPPTSPPCEGWAHALERARADGSIQQQLMREKMAEERRKKLAMLDAKRKRQITEQTITTEYLDELGNFLEKYCIIKKSDQMIFKNIFEKFDEDCDGFLWPEEVLEALENVNVNRLNDAHLRYVFRVLEHCDCQADIGIGFRLFSLIAALSQRVASLNDKMKKLITKCDFKTLDCTLERVKMLFECYVNQDTMRIYRTDLWIGLAAGGLRSAEAKIEDYFSDKNSFDFLDFLTYLPLFQEIHGYVVENPLTLF